MRTREHRSPTCGTSRWRHDLARVRGCLFDPDHGAQPPTITRHDLIVGPKAVTPDTPNGLSCPCKYPALREAGADHCEQVRLTVLSLATRSMSPVVLSY